MKSFGDNLKQARKMRKMNQQALGEAVGVGQTTIANYESGFRFPTGELLKKIGEVLNVSLDTLMEHEVVTLSIDIDMDHLEKVAEHFLDALLNDREQEAMALIWQLKPNSDNLFDIYEQVLHKTLTRIGNMWENNLISVATEHYTSAVVMKIISMLSTIPDAEAKSDVSAVCMSMSAEPHTIGIRMVSDYLRMKGILSYYIGSTVPTDSLVDMLISKKADVLALSVTMSYHMDAVKNLLDVLRMHKELAGLKIVLGGQAITNLRDYEKNELSKADCLAGSLEDIENWLAQNQLSR